MLHTYKLEVLGQWYFGEANMELCEYGMAEANFLLFSFEPFDSFCVLNEYLQFLWVACYSIIEL